MRIKRVEIPGFGCLADTKFDLPEDRAVLVLADNEHGKSTLASAIVAGLCGFPKRRPADEPVKPSEVFRPWNTKDYSVSLLLDAGGRNLVVERDFAAGRFQVRDAATNKDVSADFKEDLADSLLGLPREDFRRIAVISGKDVHRFESSVGLKSRLEALVEGTDRSNAEAAIAAIGDARYTLDDRSLKVETAQSRLSQQIADRQAEISRLDAAIDGLRQEMQEIEQLRQRKEELDRRIEDLDREYDSARNREIKEQVIAAKQFTAAGAAIAVLGFLLAAAFAAAGFAKAASPAAAAAGGLFLAVIGAVGLALALRSSRQTETLRRQMDTHRQDRGSTILSARPSWTIDSERQEAIRERDFVVRRLMELEKQIGAVLHNYRDRYPELLEECDRMCAELRKVERYQSALEAASNAMREVLDVIRRRWAEALNGLASGILPHLNPDYDTLLFDSNLDFTIRHVPGGRVLQKNEIDAFLSTGAKDQVYLAVRLACAQALSAGEPVPVILDDPFAYFDDERFESSLKCVVEQISPKQQVIVLSCHRNRHERLADSDWFKNRVEVVRL